MLRDRSDSSVLVLQNCSESGGEGLRLLAEGSREKRVPPKTCAIVAGEKNVAELKNKRTNSGPSTVLPEKLCRKYSRQRGECSRDVAANYHQGENCTIHVYISATFATSPPLPATFSATFFWQSSTRATICPFIFLNSVTFFPGYNCTRFLGHWFFPTRFGCISATFAGTVSARVSECRCC